MIYIIIIAVVIFALLVIIGKRNEKINKGISGVNFQVSTNTNDTIDKEIDKWEIVYRKTNRWAELGFGDDQDFPGYGRLYDRFFEVWYCDIGSKEKKDIYNYQDKFPLNYYPKEYEKITGENVYLEKLNNSKGYKELFTGLDNKNRRRWYFALLETKPLWVQTERAIEKENFEEIISEKIEVPEGWTLVRRKSKEWDELGFGDGELFPGYGKIYKRIFEVWYSEIGSKEKKYKPDFIDKAILNYYNGISGDLGDLKGKGLEFDILEKTKGYKSLITAVDKKERKRWYFALKEVTPTYIFTASAE